MLREMYALIMCGGKGERIRDFCSDKTMLEFNGRPLIEHIILSLKKSDRFDKIFAAASRNSKATLNFLKNHDYFREGILEIIETAGIDYSTDLVSALEKLRPAIVFVIPADIPLITPEVIVQITSNWDGDKSSISIVMDKDFVVKLGLFPTILLKLGDREFFHSGVSIFDSSKVQTGKIVKEHYITLNDEKLAFNINAKKDYFLLKSKLNQAL
jgi:GTP:adenosylcobinamide-phosphate guanylyltransferase